ncbi:MAG: methylated-DNA--[protein]-cysteine S-methyltransferase [Tannerellaceae bacterium]|jgi:methylated-DNA-[protein]-cysteine S-methyltransferase|nr:methylated-DNA--[protein]-cysteine S-methyltransferase [Tannerellaceae bacterium]
MEKKAFLYDTVLGRIGIAEDCGMITNVFFGCTVVPSEYVVAETPLLQEAASQLNEYLAGERTKFYLPMEPEGTPFQLKCWKLLQTIPYGETITYKEQASILGNPKANRAVGRCNGLNPISIFIPCHRVIGQNGSLMGYAGGVEIKKRLLNLERETKEAKGKSLFSRW